MKEILEHLDQVGALVAMLASIVFVSLGIDGELKTLFVVSSTWLIKSAFDKTKARKKQ